MTVLNTKEKYELGITNTKYDLRSIVIRKLEEMVYMKYKLLKVKSIYFDEGSISYISIDSGDNVLVRKNGIRIFPKLAKGNELIHMIKCLKTNRFYGYITDADSRKYKIRPKNKK